MRRARQNIKMLYESAYAGDGALRARDSARDMLLRAAADASMPAMPCRVYGVMLLLLISRQRVILPARAMFVPDGAR